MAAIKTEARAGAFATPLGAAPAAVLVVSSDGRIVGANRCACSILGWRHVELLALGIGDVGVSQPTMGRLYADVADHGLALGEALLRRRDGQSIPIRYQISCINLANESLYLWVTKVRSNRRPNPLDLGRRRAARALRISERELEIVQLIADGLGNREIAEMLHISVETVKTYVRRLLGKLRARSRAHAVAIAWRENLVD